MSEFIGDRYNILDMITHSINNLNSIYLFDEDDCPLMVIDDDLESAPQLVEDYHVKLNVSDFDP